MNTLTSKSLATLTLTALTSLSLQVIAAEPTPNPADGSSIKVSFHNLDFDNSNAVAGLYRRIQTSARLVCIDSTSPWDASRQETFERCYTAVVEKAVGQVNRPQLTALYRGEAKPVLAAK
jgi:UrcA family protein